MNFKNTFSSYSVNDLNQAKNFYGKTLGLDVEETPEGLGVHLGAVDLFLYPKPDHQPASFTVLNFAVDNVDEAVADLKKQGVKFESYSEFPTDKDGIFRDETGPTIAWFKDPSGNVLSVVEDKKH